MRGIAGKSSKSSCLQCLILYRSWRQNFLLQMKWAKPKNLFIEEKWYRGNEVFWQIQFNIYSWWGKGVSENLNHLWNLFIRLSHIKLHLLNYSWPIKMTVIWFNWQLWGYSITPLDNSLGLHFMTSPKFKRFEILSTSICLSVYQSLLSYLWEFLRFDIINYHKLDGLEHLKFFSRFEF